VIRLYNIRYGLVDNLRQGCRDNGAGFPGSGGKTGYLEGV